MVLSKSELISALQHEVHILVHLAGKVDGSMLDYRPTPKQRSTIELLRYLSMMGPALLTVALADDGGFNPDDWRAASEEANARGFDETVAAIAAQSSLYAARIGVMHDSAFREEINGFSGRIPRGAFIVSLILNGYAAYRTQLFLYLKACGRDDLSTTDLWQGVDAPPARA